MPLKGGVKVAEKVQLGNVLFEVTETEDMTFTNTITRNPIESGGNVAEHIENNPITIKIKGIVAGENAGQSYNELVYYWQNGIVLNYIGRSALYGAVIKSFKRNVDKDIANGFNFEITIEQVKLAYKQEININLQQTPRPKVKRRTSKGRQAVQGPPQKVSPQKIVEGATYLYRFFKKKLGG